MSHFSKLYSAALHGLEPQLVEVESDIGAGLPAFTIVGLPDKAVEESKERVRSAIKNSGIPFPQSRVIVNLAPAAVKKEGAVFDLPIALGILAADRQLKIDSEKFLVVGELALDGRLKPITGILPIAIFLKEKYQGKILILPQDNFAEANLVKGIRIVSAQNLKELISCFRGEMPLKIRDAQGVVTTGGKKVQFEYDFAYIAGQESAKRALELAAAGGHNVLMSGPPGAGKTLLARSFPSILPSLEPEDIIEVTKIYSISGLLDPTEPLIFQPPFRSPHHSSTTPSIVGGGNPMKCGEISLAHRGVLFLDELPEFHRDVLEALRQPLEDRIVTIARAQGTLTFPADFILLAAMNPCPCGYLHDSQKPCVCAPSAVVRYRKKISGPLLDRIDLHTDVPRLGFDKLTAEKVAEESAKVRQRVERARQVQARRFHDREFTLNSQMRVKDIKEFCPLDEQSKKILRSALTNLSLSARAFHRILKVSRTIADLAGLSDITVAHIAEALQYRSKEREY